MRERASSAKVKNGGKFMITWHFCRPRLPSTRCLNLSNVYHLTASDCTFKCHGLLILQRNHSKQTSLTSPVELIAYIVWKPAGFYSALMLWRKVTRFFFNFRFSFTPPDTLSRPKFGQIESFSGIRIIVSCCKYLYAGTSRHLSDFGLWDET